MSYSLIRRVNDVRHLLADKPPAASLVHAALHRRALGRDSYAIAKSLSIEEAEVYRILAADQDCRRLRTHRAA